MPRVTLGLIFEVLTIVGSLLTVVKLFQTNLHKRYQFFFCYFIYRMLITPVAIILPRSSSAYMYVWTGSQLLAWILYVLVIKELFDRILERHRGIATLGRWFMYAGTAVSLAISVVSIMPRLAPLMPQSKAMGYILGADRGITFGLVVFQLLVLLLLSRYPVHLARNVVVHAILFSIFFLCTTVTALMKSVFGLKVFTNVDLVFQAVSCACGLAWFWLLNPKGEEVTVNLSHMESGKERRLLSQLDYLNQTLLKAGKS